MNDFLKSEEIFLESLEYPQFVRAEFFIKKQIESGWSKTVFLQYLKGSYHHYQMELHLLRSKARKKSDFELMEVGIPLSKLTNGKVNEIFTGHKKTKLLNERVLSDLNEAIEKAYSLGEQEKTHTNIQLLSFFEHSIIFIKNEFEIQCGLKESIPFTRMYPKDFKSKTADGETVYLLHSYSLKQPSPILDYSLFKATVRELLLNSIHPENLAIILKPHIQYCKKIVELWNDRISNLEKENKNVVSNRRFISFDTNDEVFTSWTDIERFVTYPNKDFSNYKLAVFAFNAANLIADEVLPNGNEGKDLKKPKISLDYSLQFIKKEVHGRLNEIENKLDEKVNIWRQGSDKIGCAAFCELLFENKYFVSGSTRIKSLNAFALSRYGNDIKIQLEASKKRDRKIHKMQLKWSFS